jgi:hypothetical protein
MFKKIPGRREPGNGHGADPFRLHGLGKSVYLTWCGPVQCTRKFRLVLGVNCLGLTKTCSDRGMRNICA